MRNSQTTEVMEAEDPGVDWKALREEFTMDQLWGNRSWKCIGLVFAIGFICRLVPSSFDLGTEGVSAKRFIVGNNYIKNIDIKKGDNLTELFGNNSDCSHIGRFTRFTEEGEEIVYEQVQCFERDYIWGIFTATCIFLPGVWAPMFLGHISTWENNLYFYSLWVLSIPLFPFIVIGVHLVGLFNPGPQWKKLTKKISAAEGSGEATLQFCLQLFIIFTLGDRQPSVVQLATLTASLFLLINTGMDDYMKANPPKDLKEELRRKKDLLLIFLASTIFKLGSVAVMAATLRYWAFLCCYVPWNGGLVLFYCFGSKMKDLTKMFPTHPLGLKLWYDPSWTKKKTMKNCLFCNVYWFLSFSVVLMAIAILANFFPETDLLSHTLSSIAIVKKIFLLNTILFIVMLCGIVSIGFIFLEYDMARAEAEEIERRSITEESYEKDEEE
jgi:hypothetical protein